MKENILSQLSAECPWRDTLYWYDTIDSTNTKAKVLAREGAPHGTVLVAGHQTGGRGRLGRSFSSPSKMGVYLSLILRPGCKPDGLMHLTCAAAVAVCDAVEQCAGFRPGIKWTNDLVHQKKKLGGILTELYPNPVTGLVDYCIIGIGINCCQTAGDFPREIQDMAASLYMVTGQKVLPETLAAALVEALVNMEGRLLSQPEKIMADYRADCITLGQDVRLVRGDEIRYGTALDLDEMGGLIVRFADGTVKTVTSGEISIRGMYGYL